MAEQRTTTTAQPQHHTEEVIVPARLHHINLMAFEYDSLDDLMRTYLRLKRLDILPALAMDLGITTSFYYRDPDGNYVELQVDNFGLDPGQSTVFMHSPRFSTARLACRSTRKAMLLPGAL